MRELELLMGEKTIVKNLISKECLTLTSKNLVRNHFLLLKTACN